MSKKNSTKKAPKSAKTSKARKIAPAAKPEKMSGLDAAAHLLKETGEAMKPKAMVEMMVKKGYWQSEGKTPGATIYAAIIREIAAKNDGSRFKKTGRGTFAFNG